MLRNGLLGCVLACLVLLAQIADVQALYEGMYCGKENCYDVLGVTRGEIIKKDLNKVCRNKLREFHPDKNLAAQHDKELRAKLEKDWEKYSIACETIRDDDKRKEYDHLLDNPDEFFYAWWYYHRPRVSTTIDVGFVIIVLLTVISLGQFYFINQSFEISVNEILFDNDKLRHNLSARAEREGHGALLRNKKGKPVSKDEQKKVLYDLYADDIGLEANLDRYEWDDVLWVRLFVWIVKLPLFVYHTVKYFIRHWVMDCEYNDDEQEYMTRKRMLISRKNWERHTQDYKDSLIAKELWNEANWKAYREEQEEQVAAYFLSNSEMKQYKKQKKRQ
ncbi:hypothetical protein SARC_00313 [Sphaeroforma arctica JP610]|uniref:J domain-containing protein n=1 Tax=Sphaeroforma arctica JP610 TaxID=667725 RepID=A0A0L0GH13_9EUKA|nr:hypothetical protein SARC_00313 [Sphaeroforma arctica JP610]KNC87613.1 hypothetical protein SARC_00313 [Sphaeroforma arctica JP610]|eukprot:XP_014161515.1 hypothetical protein SARC_00313 [Sphaeroforma arctica JP610]